MRVREINLAQAELGKKLYFDPRLSKSGFISCNSCHNLSMGGTDNLQTSIGHNWQEGPINAPMVLSSSLNVAQFWDGRAADLKEQAGCAVLVVPSRAAGVELAQRDEVGIREPFEAFLHDRRLWHLARGYAVIEHLVEEVASRLAGQRRRLLVLEVAVLLVALLTVFGMECPPALGQLRVGFPRLAGPGLGPEVQRHAL